MQLEVGDKALVGHIGQFMGATAIGVYSPEAGYVIAVTCNLSSPDIVAVVADLQAIILEHAW